MWQSPPFKISQPEQDTCHNPPLTKLTNQILPRHHLLHLTHETLTLIFLLSFQPPQPPPHLFMPPHHGRPATTAHQRRRPHSRRRTTAPATAHLLATIAHHFRGHHVQPPLQPDLHHDAPPPEEKRSCHHRAVSSSATSRPCTCSQRHLRPHAAASLRKREQDPHQICNSITAASSH